MTSHYGPIDGIGSPVYDPAVTGHHGRVTGSLPPAIPRSPTYSPHPSAASAAVSSLAGPYSAAAGAGVAGFSSATGAAAAAAAAAAAMNSSSSAAAVAAVDNLLKRDKDAIYRSASATQLHCY